jgi:hypothetical protein
MLVIGETEVTTFNSSMGTADADVLEKLPPVLEGEPMVVLLDPIVLSTFGLSLDVTDTNDCYF